MGKIIIWFYIDNVLFMDPRVIASFCCVIEDATRLKSMTSFFFLSYSYLIAKPCIKWLSRFFFLGVGYQRYLCVTYRYIYKTISRLKLFLFVAIHTWTAVYLFSTSKSFSSLYRFRVLDTSGSKSLILWGIFFNYSHFVALCKNDFRKYCEISW